MSHEPKRRRTANASLAALDAEIKIRRSEIAAIERARDTISRALDEVECSNAIHSGGTTCSGHKHTGRCKICGFAVVVCEGHDGARTVAKLLASHQRWHVASYGEQSTPDDNCGMSDGAPLPLGQLPFAPIT